MSQLTRLSTEKSQRPRASAAIVAQCIGSLTCNPLVHVSESVSGVAESGAMLALGQSAMLPSSASIDQTYPCIAPEPPQAMADLSVESCSVEFTHPQQHSAAVLPRNTVVLISGNNRTKKSLVGHRAVVKRCVGLGGWHHVSVYRSLGVLPPLEQCA